MLFGYTPGHGSHTQSELRWLKNHGGDLRKHLVEVGLHIFPDQKNGGHKFGWNLCLHMMMFMSFNVEHDDQW